MNRNQVIQALENRFRVLHGAQGELEVALCTGLVLLAPAVLMVTEQAWRGKTLTAMLAYLIRSLQAASTPPERIRDLLKATGEETAQHLNSVRTSVEAREPS